ncbi:MAG: S-layer homology domain-containing protein [bacterium]
MKKSISKFLLALLLCNSVMSVAQAKDFTDLTSKHWAYKQIQSLAKENIVVGYPDGSFHPDNAATRAEFATMVIKALKQENSPLAEAVDYKDVNYSYWAYNTIQRAQAFDLIKGFPDGTFRPEDNVSKAEAIAILISAVNTGDMTEAEAKQYLKKYVDLKQIPAWALVPAGKAEKYKVSANPPQAKKNFNPDSKITRAEIAVSLYNMKKQALINPNAKLAEAMKPKIARGILLENVAIDGTIATIPAGSVIPVKFTTPINSQNVEVGTVFLSSIYDNIVSKDSYLLIKQGSTVTGDVAMVKPARYILRNAKLGLDSKNINTPSGQKAAFPGIVVSKDKKGNWFVRAVRFIIKGKKIKIPADKIMYIELSKPVKVDLTNTTIIE